MDVQDIKLIISDIEAVDKKDILYEALKTKLNNSLVTYFEDLTKLSEELSTEDYLDVIKIIARRIKL